MEVGKKTYPSQCPYLRKILMFNIIYCQYYLLSICNIQQIEDQKKEYPMSLL